jgi:hypothetical protein
VSFSWIWRARCAIIGEGGAMNDHFCLFVILTSLIGLVLPPGGALIYLVFAGVLVWMAAVAGGIDHHGQATTEPSNTPSREQRRFGA